MIDILRKHFKTAAFAAAFAATSTAAAADADLVLTFDIQNVYKFRITHHLRFVLKVERSLPCFLKVVPQTKVNVAIRTCTISTKQQSFEN